MILASTVYELLIDQIRADKRGLNLSVDEYNRFARVVNERLYSRYYSDFESNTGNIDTMSGFKVLAYTIALTAGVGSLPSNYYELIGKPKTVDALGVTRRVDLVSSIELDEREDDYLTAPSTTYPCMILAGEDALGNSEIVVYPTTITSVDVDYLRTANVPYLDYYTNDTTFVQTYMATGATVSVPVGSTYRDGTAGGGAGIVSQTINWEWSDSDLGIILAMFAQMIGLALPDPLLLQAGNADEQKN